MEAPEELITLSEEEFRPALSDGGYYSGNNFHFDLTEREAASLLQLMRARQNRRSAISSTAARKQQLTTAIEQPSSSDAAAQATYSGAASAAQECREAASQEAKARGARLAAGVGQLAFVKGSSLGVSMLQSKAGKKQASRFKAADQQAPGGSSLPEAEQEPEQAASVARERQTGQAEGTGAEAQPAFPSEDLLQQSSSDSRPGVGSAALSQVTEAGKERADCSGAALSVSQAPQQHETAEKQQGKSTACRDSFVQPTNIEAPAIASTAAPSLTQQPATSGMGTEEVQRAAAPCSVGQLSSSGMGLLSAPAAQSESSQQIPGLAPTGMYDLLLMQPEVGVTAVQRANETGIARGFAATDAISSQRARQAKSQLQPAASSADMGATLTATQPPPSLQMPPSHILAVGRQLPSSTAQPPFSTAQQPHSLPQPAAAACSTASLTDTCRALCSALTAATDLGTGRQAELAASIRQAMEAAAQVERGAVQFRLAMEAAAQVETGAAQLTRALRSVASILESQPPALAVPQAAITSEFTTAAALPAAPLSLAPAPQSPCRDQVRPIDPLPPWLSPSKVMVAAL